MNQRGNHMKALFGIVLLLITFLPGCGGSTRGTGGVTVEGRVQNTSGSPQSGVEVTILQTGDSSTTDEQGSYSIQSSALEALDLLLERGDFAAQINIPDVDLDTTRVIAEIQIDTASNQAAVTKVDKEKRRPAANEDDSSSGSGKDDNNDDSSDDDSSPGNDDSDSGSGSNSGSDDDSSDDHGSSNSGSGSDDDSVDDSDDDGGDSGSGSADDDSSSDDTSDDDSDDSPGSGQGSSGNPPPASGCQEVELTGPIQAISSSSISVGGIEFLVDAQTEVEDLNNDPIQLADLDVGENVQIKGECRSSVLFAERIRLED